MDYANHKGRLGKCSFCQNCSNFITDKLQTAFYWLGLGISSYPYITIFLSLACSGALISGITKFYEEEEPGKLFVPQNFEVIGNSSWVYSHFYRSIRYQYIILEGKNVLTPEGLQTIKEIDDTIKSFRVNNSKEETSFSGVCYVSAGECLSTSLLMLWGENSTAVTSVTNEDILTNVNRNHFNEFTGRDVVIDNLIGGIQNDDNGRIVGATAALLTYAVELRSISAFGNPEGRTGEWEFQFLAEAERLKNEITEFDIMYLSERSETDMRLETIDADLKLLFPGYAILLIFVSFVLGQFNMINNRIILSLIGILTIGISLGVSIGVCSYIGVPYGPIHSVIPFMILGLGVDDMFVLIRAFETLPEDIKSKKLSIQIAYTVKHAGLSITITSFTDMAAFGVGSLTIIPALSSFCWYAFAAVFCVYMLLITLFTACLTLNERRALNTRNAILCCIKHSDTVVPSRLSKFSIVQYIFDKYIIPWLSKLFVQVPILICSAALLGASIFGVSKLETDSDVKLTFPTDSYAWQFYLSYEKLFSNTGVATSIFLGDMDYYKNYDKLLGLCESIINDPYTMNGSVACWISSYDNWPDKDTSTEEKFYQTLKMFRNDITNGRIFASNIKYNFTADVLKPQESLISLRHIVLKSLKDRITAMTNLRNKCQLYDIEGVCFAYTDEYIEYDTESVMKTELFRNLGITFIAVLIMSYILITNLWACLLLMLCIVSTLVETAGMLYYWGYKIDLVTVINLILVIGLAVDYSAHIIHKFLLSSGNKKERMKQTLHEMGPAVVYGGFSTFLAFIMLAGSTSYVFKVFFRTFFGITLFGVFNGVIILPILLFCCGPNAYKSSHDARMSFTHDRLQYSQSYSNGDSSPKQISFGKMAFPSEDLLMSKSIQYDKLFNIHGFQSQYEYLRYQKASPFVIPRPTLYSKDLSSYRRDKPPLHYIENGIPFRSA